MQLFVGLFKNFMFYYYSGKILSCKLGSIKDKTKDIVSVVRGIFAKTI